MTHGVRQTEGEIQAQVARYLRDLGDMSDDHRALIQDHYAWAVSSLEMINSYLRDLGPMFDGGSPITRAEITREWLDAFDNPIVCRAWMDAGFWSPYAAWVVSSLGIEPHEVAARCKTISEDILEFVGYEVEDPVYAICNGDLDARCLLYDDEDDG